MSQRFKVTFTATVICTQIVEMNDPSGSMNAGWLEDDLNNGQLSTQLEKGSSIETLPEMVEVGRILASDCAALRFEGFRVVNEENPEKSDEEKIGWLLSSVDTDDDEDDDEDSEDDEQV